MTPARPMRKVSKMRMSLWPRLSTFPTTNGMLVMVIILWTLTGVCALMPYESFNPPDRWYQALEVLTGIVVVQFIGKRGTDTQLWRRKEPDGGERGS